MVFEYELQAPEEKRPRLESPEHRTGVAALIGENDSEAETVPVYFTAMVPHDKSEELENATTLLVGDLDVLGNDDISKGVQMHRRSDGAFVAMLDLFPEDTFTYRYVLVTPGAEPRFLEQTTVNVGSLPRVANAIHLQSTLDL